MKEILKLLKQGCEIHFTSGYVLKGEPDSGHINTGWIYCGEYVPESIKELTEEGLLEAINDATNFNVIDRT